MTNSEALLLEVVVEASLRPGLLSLLLGAEARQRQGRQLVTHPNVGLGARHSMRGRTARPRHTRPKEEEEEEEGEEEKEENKTA